MGLHRIARAPLAHSTAPSLGNTAGRRRGASSMSPGMACSRPPPPMSGGTLCAICQIGARLGRSRSGRRQRRAHVVRVAILIVLASLIWVPIGVAVGLRPKLTERIQPIAQFLAAFPANLLFPVAVFLILRFELSPRIWLTPLMILGTQWYILFNVIAGASAFPDRSRAKPRRAFASGPGAGGARSCCRASSPIM